MNAAATTTARRDAAAQPVLGIVKITYRRLDLTQPAVNDADVSGAAELEAWGRRAFAANGFGDADVALPAGTLPPRSTELDAASRAHRSAAFWQICAAIGGAIGAAIGRAVTRWREHLALRRTYTALAGLDERTLKDIGFGTHEAGSIAAELAGRAERTRMQALRTLRDLTI
jgi:uncharacterized protein YjiS (DUF1127 family)